MWYGIRFPKHMHALLVVLNCADSAYALLVVLTVPESIMRGNPVAALENALQGCSIVCTKVTYETYAPLAAMMSGNMHSVTNGGVFLLTTRASGQVCFGSLSPSKGYRTMLLDARTGDICLPERDSVVEGVRANYAPAAFSSFVSGCISTWDVDLIGSDLNGGVGGTESVTVRLTAANGRSGPCSGFAALNALGDNLRLTADEFLAKYGHFYAKGVYHMVVPEIIKNAGLGIHMKPHIPDALRPFCAVPASFYGINSAAFMEPFRADMLIAVWNKLISG